MIIPVGITAKNEGQNLPLFLRSLRQAVKTAEKNLPAKFELHLILNDNTDDSAEKFAGEKDLQIWQTSGGLVEAQRFFRELMREAPFLIFSDADLLLGENVLLELVKTLLENPSVEITYAHKIPLPPILKTPLARALYLYNLNEGYQDKRHYLNGQLFAIRDWNIPRVEDLHWTPALNSRFLQLEAGIRCDDLFLSRDLLQRLGPASIRQVEAPVWSRPPATLQGMYRKYQRMALEIERLDHYFPLSRPAHDKWGRRRLQKSLITSRPLSEIFYYAIFLAALWLCKRFYALEKFYYGRWSQSPCPTWKPVAESKSLA